MYIPLQMALVLFLPTPLNITALWRMKIGFWMARKHQFCDCSVYIQGHCQWQAPKVNGKEEWKGEGRVRGKQNAIWGRNATYSMCEGDLPWIHKNLWQPIICWGSKGLQRIKHIFHTWKTATTGYSIYKLVIFTLVNNFQLISDNMDELSCTFTSQVCRQC